MNNYYISRDITKKIGPVINDIARDDKVDFFQYSGYKVMHESNVIFQESNGTGVTHSKSG